MGLGGCNPIALVPPELVILNAGNKKEVLESCFRAGSYLSTYLKLILTSLALLCSLSLPVSLFYAISHNP